MHRHAQGYLSGLHHRRGREFASQTFDYFETYTVIALVYLIITLLLSKGVSMMEGRLTYYDRDRK